MLLAIVEAEGDCPTYIEEQIRQMCSYRGAELVEHMFNFARRAQNIDAVGRCLGVNMTTRNRLDIG